MASESSFDVVSKVDRQEVDNAVNQAAKEVAQRYDFKGVGASVGWSGQRIVMTANSEDRAKAVLDPRGVLADFGVTLPEGQTIRVWDSTAETRFIVIPMRPAGTEGWSEEELAAIVTRDSMIGTGLPVISAHVVIDDQCFESGHAPQILEEILTCVKEHFPVSIDHATIQLETAAVRDR